MDLDKELRQELERVMEGKWFAPIFYDLERFDETAKECLPEELFPWQEEDFPEWGFRCLLKTAMEDAEYTGFGMPADMDSRRIGKIIGCKWALYEGMVRLHPVFMNLSDKQVCVWDERFGEGAVAELLELSGKCVAKFGPRISEIQKRALSLVRKQSMQDVIDFHQGFAQGIKFLAHVARRSFKPKGKREIDWNRRAAVYWAAMVSAKEIEANKAELTWESITEGISEALENRIELDSATVKKNLQGVGLKSVGTVGRPSIRNREEE